MSEVESRVNVHSKLTVVSSRPTGPRQTHKLNGPDRAMGLHSLHAVLYFKTNPFLIGQFESAFDNLRVSLSELLCSYPNVTGRLTRGAEGNWEVKCNDAGVRTIRAKVGATIDEWLRSADGFEERDLTVWEDRPDDPSIWSPFRIQVNEFNGGGLAIGLSCGHMHADITSLAMFLKSWADVHRGRPISPTPAFELIGKLIAGQPNLKTAEFYSNKSARPKPNSAKMASATFRFSGPNIIQYLSEVRPKFPNLGPFDVLAALFWTRIALSKKSSYAQKNYKSSISICLDFRKLMQGPLPSCYFGNAVHFSDLSSDAEVLDDDGIGHVAETIRRHVATLGCGDFLSGVNWFEAKRGEIMGKDESPFEMYGPELTIVCLEHMMYEAVFNDSEMPVHVSCHVGNVKGEGLVLVMPSPEGGMGRTVTVTLPEEEMARLMEDRAIMELEPTLVLSGRR